MKTKLSFLLLVILCVSCTKQDKTNKDVAQLRKDLPLFETPTEFNSDRMVKYRSVEMPDNGLIKELQEKEVFTLLGKLFETKDNITILGYVPAQVGTPILITFDNTGKKISAHLIYETALREIGHHTSNIVKVLPDRQILFTDSTITKKMNKEGTEEIPGTDSVYVIHKKYRLTEEGIIENVN